MTEHERTNGNEVEVRGPKGWGASLKGRYAVLGGLAAVVVVVLVAYLVWSATHDSPAMAALRERLPESKKEHATIDLGIRQIAHRLDVQTCVLTLDPVERKALRDRARAFPGEGSTRVVTNFFSPLGSGSFRSPCMTLPRMTTSPILPCSSICRNSL